LSLYVHHEGPEREKNNIFKKRGSRGGFWVPVGSVRGKDVPKQRKRKERERKKS